MLAELLRWIDAELLLACLLEAMPRTEVFSKPQTLTPQALGRPEALADARLLRRLVPAHLYTLAMQSGWSGMHALSFALRHRLTELNQLFHQSPEDDNLIESWVESQGPDRLPIFGFSPIGIHWALRPRGHCRAFDAYAIPQCAAIPEGVFCPAHAAEAWWHEETKGSAQALMYRYYANLENFTLHAEADLEAMVHAFWKKWITSSADELAAALVYFGWRDADDLKRSGSEALRRKFLQLSLVHHPDRGGQESAFLVLQEHYQRLKNFLRMA